MFRRKSVFAAAFAALIALCLSVVPTPLRADGVDNEGPFTMLTGRLGRGDDEALFLWDKVERKLAVYLVSPVKMELLFVRNCKFDFEADINSKKMTPTPNEVKRILKDDDESTPRRGGEKKGADKKGADKKSAKPKEAGETADDDLPEGEKAEASTTTNNSPVSVGQAAAGGGWSLSLGKFQGGSSDALYIWSHEKKRLAVYSIRGNTLELLFSRNCVHDFKIGRSLGRMTPRVKDLEEQLAGRKTDKSEARRENGAGQPRD